MALLLRYVANTWQTVATATPYDSGGGYNNDAQLPIASVDAMLASTGVVPQTLAGRTQRMHMALYRSQGAQYEARNNGGAATSSVYSGGAEEVTTDITAALEAAVGGLHVQIVDLALQGSPPVPPFWTSKRNTVEIV